VVCVSVHRTDPSSSHEYWVGPSLADRSQVELALLPRLSLTRLSQTQSLFLEDVLHSLAILPQGA